jgi:hypothetical protein
MAPVNPRRAVAAARNLLQPGPKCGFDDEVGMQIDSALVCKPRRRSRSGGGRLPAPGACSGGFGIDEPGRDSILTAHLCAELVEAFRGGRPQTKLVLPLTM